MLDLSLLFCVIYMIECTTDCACSWGRGVDRPGVSQKNRTGRDREAVRCCSAGIVRRAGEIIGNPFVAKRSAGKDARDAILRLRFPSARTDEG
jgi:hypothetical protein